MRAVENATGDQQVNTFHYDLVDPVLGGTNANDPQLLADAFVSAVVTPFRAFYGTSWTIQPVVVAQEIDPQDPHAARSEWVSGTAVAGTRSPPSDTLPKAACAVVSLTTTHIGKRYRGRLFLGGTLGETDQTAGVWQSGITTLWAAYIAAVPRQPDLVAGVSPATADWSVYSRTNRTQDIDPYLSPIVSNTLRTQFRWLRSREA